MRRELNQWHNFMEHQNVRSIRREDCATAKDLEEKSLKKKNRKVRLYASQNTKEIQ